eukprot:1670533-Pyramimonas_sp.AAC.1
MGRETQDTRVPLFWQGRPTNQTSLYWSAAKLWAVLACPGVLRLGTTSLAPPGWVWYGRWSSG